MLDLDKIDLSDLVMALEDHSPEVVWSIDPETGEVQPWFESDEESSHPIDRGLVCVEPITSSEGYREMEEFIPRVPDANARDLLERAIAGRGAFRRFKDTLAELPELRDAWFRFHDTRMERRALRWLADQELIDVAAAEAAIELRPDPELPATPSAFDASGIAKAVTRDLRNLYGDRLRQVLLFGSWARGDAHPESDIDLLVVLDAMESSWEELRRMDVILTRHSCANDTVVTALPVSEGDFRAQDLPALIRARAEGKVVA